MTFQEAHPKEKTKQVEDHLRKVWNGEIKSTYSCVNLDYKKVGNEEKMIERAATNILKSSEYPGYNPPRFNVSSSTVSTAAYWGGEIMQPIGGNKHIRPVISDPEDAAKVKTGDPECGDAGRGISMFNEVCQRLGTEDLYCTTIDFQGPLNTAALSGSKLTLW